MVGKKMATIPMIKTTRDNTKTKIQHPVKSQGANLANRHSITTMAAQLATAIKTYKWRWYHKVSTPQISIFSYQFRLISNRCTANHSGMGQHIYYQ